MSSLTKRTTTRVAVAALILTGSTSVVSATLARAELADGVGEVPPAVAEVERPTYEELLEMADYVSGDGKHVRIGEVEISTTDVVVRADAPID